MAEPRGRGVKILLVIVLGCLGCELFLPGEPARINLGAFSLPPGREYWFGTDSMGRDIFSMIWYGGRISLLIGAAATFISTVLALVIGALSGMGPEWLDRLLMYLTDVMLAIPGFLFTLFFQGMWGKRTAIGLAFAIGLTGWPSMARVARMQVRQIQGSGYVLAAKAMGCSFWHMLWVHLTPGLVSSMMFMVVMNFRNAMVAEATLSFMGMGLPPESVTWGSMLSLAEDAFLSGAWWVIVIPGSFLIITLLCVTELGEYLRKRVNPGGSNL